MSGRMSTLKRGFNYPSSERSPSSSKDIYLVLSRNEQRMVSRTAVKSRTGSKGTSVKNRGKSIKPEDEWKVRPRSSFTSGFAATIFDRRIVVAGGVRNFFTPLRQPTTEGKTTFRPFPRHRSTFYRFIAVFR